MGAGALVGALLDSLDSGYVVLPKDFLRRLDSSFRLTLKREVAEDARVFAILDGLGRKPGWCDSEHENFDETENERAMAEQHAYDTALESPVSEERQPEGPMTDRFIALTVLLDREIRDDDAQPIIAAIAMIKGVSKVTPVVSSIETHYAYEKGTT